MRVRLIRVNGTRAIWHVQKDISTNGESITECRKYRDVDAYEDTGIDPLQEDFRARKLCLKCRDAVVNDAIEAKYGSQKDGAV